MKPKVERDIDRRKYRVTRLLLDTFSYFAIFVFIYFVAYQLVYWGNLSLPNELIRIILYSIGVLLIGLLRLKLNENNYSIIYSSILLISLIYSLGLITFYGINQVFPWIVILTLLHSSSVVFSLRFAKYFILLICFITIVISSLHRFSLIQPSYELIDSNLPNTVAIIIFMVINYKIIQIIFIETENSYRMVLDYAEKMDRANQELDDIIKSRTEQIEVLWQERISSLDRVITLGSVASAILHDLRTPLSSISISIQMFKEKLFYKTNASEFEEPIEGIVMASEQLLDVISASESLISIRQGKRKFSVYEEISKSIKVIKNIVEKEQVIMLVDNSNEVLIFGDPRLFRRVIINLLMNSVEELKSKDGKREITVKNSIEDNKLCISIRDNGNGINQSSIDKIFIDGVTNKNTSKHFGLGLPFVKKVVEKEMNGTIRVQSRVGEYTAFIMCLDYLEINEL